MANTTFRTKTFYQGISVINPKRSPTGLVGRASWYPYYAGFSHTFAESLLASLKLPPRSRVLDPWNGSGTTSSSAAAAGFRAHGFDINPVMVIAARARMLSLLTKESLLPIASDISQKATSIEPPQVRRNDPLEIWLTPDSAQSFRRIDASIRHLLVSQKNYSFLSEGTAVNELSDLASFYYVALFRSLRRILGTFFASNPTWVKKPPSIRNRLRPTFSRVLSVFDAEVSAMVSALGDGSSTTTEGSSHLAIASSECLPTETGSIDAVLTSPPYCTRIDYAIATSIELALLGVDSKHGFSSLRKAMIGTAVVPSTPPKRSDSWGPTCLTFLDRISDHPSKASGSYYLKNHLQYFHSVFSSLSELSRTLVVGGTCAIVVQDSYYKEIHNDLPQVFVEMGQANAMRLGHRVDFDSLRTMAVIHPHTRQYRASPRARESVLLLYRE
jgi:hypothetical protein